MCSPGAAVLRPVCYEEEMDINCSFSCLDGLLLLSDGVSKVTRTQRTMLIDPLTGKSIYFECHKTAPEIRSVLGTDSWFWP